MSSQVDKHRERYERKTKSGREENWRNNIIELKFLQKKKKKIKLKKKKKIKAGSFSFIWELKDIFNFSFQEWCFFQKKKKEKTPFSYFFGLKRRLRDAWNTLERYWKCLQTSIKKVFFFFFQGAFLSNT